VSGKAGAVAVVACVACCAAPVGTSAVALVGSAVTLIYPVEGLLILAVGAGLAWRYHRKRRAARSQTAAVDLPSVIPVGPPGG
jgi:hypothetical protein